MTRASACTAPRHTSIAVGASRAVLGAALLACLSLAGMSLTNPAQAQSLEWPTAGGIEDWGFARPAGCQPGNAYLAPLALKYQSVYGVKPLIENTTTHRQYTQPGDVRAFIDKVRSGGPAGAEGKALSGLAKELKERTDSFAVGAANYARLNVRAGPVEQIVSNIRRFVLTDGACKADGARSPASTALCNLAAQLIEHTVQLENAMQIACHAGQNVPSYPRAAATIAPATAAPAPALLPVAAPPKVPVAAQTPAQTATAAATAAPSPALTSTNPPAIPAPSTAAVVVPSGEAEPTSPGEVCGKRVFLSRERCILEQCALPQWKAHGQCTRRERKGMTDESAR